MTHADGGFITAVVVLRGRKVQKKKDGISLMEWNLASSCQTELSQVTPVAPPPKKSPTAHQGRWWWCRGTAACRDTAECKTAAAAAAASVPLEASGGQQVNVAGT